VLTDAERAVADLVARGMPNAEIAARLHLAHGTVKNTVSALLRKLDEPDRTALALRLARDL
jgi:DNA-binding NarL/FixJ family response regulator